MGYEINFDMRSIDAKPAGKHCGAATRVETWLSWVEAQRDRVFQRWRRLPVQRDGVDESEAVGTLLDMGI
ncbi:hypothetical protein SESBI_32679 [Sesbania bispinosa]|nr:hypothetical protein SESBI_32679 [Sesbania bispinosa]